MRASWGAALVALIAACGQEAKAPSNPGQAPPGEVGGVEAPPPPPATPPVMPPLDARPPAASPAGCATAWGGPKRFDAALPPEWGWDFDGLALGPDCSIDVSGLAWPPTPRDAWGQTDWRMLLARLAPAGALDERLDVGGADDPGGVLAVDAAGNRLVAWNALHAGPMIAKLAPDGTELWRSPVPIAPVPPDALGVVRTEVLAIAIDPLGDAVVIGLASAVTGSTARSFGWVSKLDGVTGAGLWSEYPFGSDLALDVAVDRGGNVLLAGGNSWKSGTGPWIAKLAPDGTLLHAGPFGSAWSDGVEAIAADASGNAYVAGEAWRWAPAPPGTKQRLIDGFLAKLDPAGNPVWTQRFTDAERRVYVSDVAVDASGNACVSGQFASGAFVARYDPSGERLWLDLLGTAWDDARSVAIDALGNCYVLAQLTGGMFVVKLGPDGTVQ